MLGRRVLTLLAVLAALGPAQPAVADEGQWPPEQLRSLDLAHLGNLGLRLKPDELWKDRGGLMRAAVQLSGCSGAFVSARGLVITNHHCAYRAVQSVSTVESDFLSHGFLAKGASSELPAKGYTVAVIDQVKDVTATIREVSQAAPDDRARARVVEHKERELVAECEKQAGHRCRVESFSLGSRYELIDTLELRDVRLVYAPPASVGEFGGEIDNWMWPRHTGDFAFLRAYVGENGEPADYSEKNVPYEPKAWLKLGVEGVGNGDLVAVIGYPGRTERYLTLAELTQAVEQELPAAAELAGDWLGILDAEAKRGPAVALKIAAQRKQLANREKNARGMIAGLTRMKLVERRAREEARLRAWAAGKPERKAGIEALDAMDQLVEARRARFARAHLLMSLARGPNLLAVAVDLARRAREHGKPDLERRSGTMDRDAERQWKLEERRLADYDVQVDARLLASLGARAARLPEGQKLDALAKLGSVAAIQGKLRASRLSNVEATKALYFAADSALIDKSTDPMLVLGRTLAAELERLDTERDAEQGALERVGPAYYALLEAERGGTLYPDANGTLRISFATVRGYSPEDGLLAVSRTTLRGAVEKSTGEEPFNLPRAVIERAAEAKNSYWADPDLDDVPVCFLSNADTTGGNSGSPVINGRGELVGLNFDRVWENIAGDYGYSVPRSRNISVDVRYLLWMLDRVADASELLQELGASSYRSAPSRRERTQSARRHLAAGPTLSAAPSPPPAPSAAATPEARSCACRAPGGPTSGLLPPFITALGLIGLRARRRR